MAYSYDPIFAQDPNNPNVVASNASITIFDPADPAKAPIAITDPTGVPLTNPVTVDARGMGSAFKHATLDRVGWFGAGFTGYFTSYEGMKTVAVDAKTAAQSAANDAASAASEVVTAAAVDGSGNLVLTKASGATVNAGAVKGAKGDKGDTGAKGADGSNVLPTDTAIQQAINDTASATRGALNATYVPKWKANTAYVAGQAVLNPNGDTVTAKTSFTSGSSYNAAYWNSAPAVAAKLDKLPVFRPAAPLVAFTFDDSYSQDLSAIKPLLEAKGVRGTFCAITGSIGTGGRMSWADLSTLAAAGHEVIPHSRTHVDHTTLTQTQLDSEINGSIQDFKDHGLTPTGYCYPLSASNATVRAQVRSQVGYGLGATGSVTVNQPPLRTYALGRVSLTQTSDLPTLKAAVDTAVANNQLLIFLSHSGTELNTSTQMLSDVIDYVKTTAAQIVTVSQALSLVGNVLDVGDYASGSTKYAVVGGNGSFASPDAVSSLAVIGNVNESATALPSSFAAGKVTYSTVNGANATGWPVSTTAANVITDRTNTTNAAYWMQTYITAAGAMYTRHGTGTDAWGSWLQVATGTPTHAVTSANSPDGNAAPTSFALGTTLTQIGGATPTGPSSQAGILRTHRASSTDATWTVQYFEVYRGTASYRRMADTTTTWKAWQQLTT